MDSPSAQATEAELLKKLLAWCAYQDRCSHDALEKMAKLELPDGQHQALLLQLQEEGYVDDERYARSVARGKHNHLHWGRKNIAYFLKLKQLPKELINRVLDEEIDPEAYAHKLHTLLHKKAAEQAGKRKNLPAFLLDYASRKGYEYDLITQTLQGLSKVLPQKGQGR